MSSSELAVEENKENVEVNTVGSSDNLEKACVKEVEVRETEPVVTETSREDAEEVVTETVTETPAEAPAVTEVVVPTETVEEIQEPAVEEVKPVVVEEPSPVVVEEPSPAVEEPSPAVEEPVAVVEPIIVVEEAKKPSVEITQPCKKVSAESIVSDVNTGDFPTGEGAYLVLSSANNGTMLRIWSKTPPEGNVLAFAQAGKPQQAFKFQKAGVTEMKRECDNTKNFYHGYSCFLKEVLSKNVMATRIFVYPAKADKYAVQIARLERPDNTVASHFGGWWNCEGCNIEHIVVVGVDVADFRVNTLSAIDFSAIGNKKFGTVLTL